MALAAVIALGLAARHAAPAVCANEEREQLSAAEIAFAVVATPASVEIRLYDYEDHVTAAEETYLRDAIDDSLTALVPTGSNVDVTWAPIAAEPAVACDQVPGGLDDHGGAFAANVKGGRVHVFKPTFNAGCNYQWAGIAEVAGDQAATLEDPSDPYFVHLLLHEIGHLLGVNHATVYATEYGDPTDAVGNRRMLRPNAEISTLAAGSLAVLEWLTLLRPEEIKIVPELGVTNQAIRLMPGLLLSFRGTRGHDAALRSQFQNACFLHTIATDTPQPGAEHFHSTLLAGPFTTDGATVGHITVTCTKRPEGGAIFSVRSNTQMLKYIPEATPSFFLILGWGGFAACGILRSTLSSP